MSFLSESATLTVVSSSIDGLFSNKAISTESTTIEGRLVIPEYQRPYIWGVKEVKRLVEDLIIHFSKEREHNYYLGSIILHQSWDGKLCNLNVIDGQQRLTTLAILANVLGLETQSTAQYSAPTSLQNIAKNIRWLTLWITDYEEDKLQMFLENFELSKINVTLVITPSEDDAYRFFETQNTGGVRLNGADIIKAHHLRAISEQYQDSNAKLWESLGELTPLIDAIMKVRYWHGLNFKSLPTHRAPQLVKKEIVAELSESCLNDYENVAYRSVKLIKGVGGHSNQISQMDNGYAMRQPLNSGINTIDYLSYFSRLQQALLLEKGTYPHLGRFYDFYFSDVIQKIDGTSFLKKLFDSCLLLYVSQFGIEKLHEASLWLFRMVYSPRLINQKTVKEASIPSFVEKQKVFDYIVHSFTHEQLIDWLKSYSYTVDGSNLGDNNVKGRFVNRVKIYFSAMSVNQDDVVVNFDLTLRKAIQQAVFGEK